MEPVAAPHASSTQASHGHEDMHDDTHTAGAAAKKKRVPAHYENAASIRALPLTLAPEQFFGRAREGYQAARASSENARSIALLLLLRRRLRAQKPAQLF
ncbi:MAG: hypothetical protein WKF84_08710 [Pyrinomonadaceae bacterium]